MLDFRGGGRERTLGGNRAAKGGPWLEGWGFATCSLRVLRGVGPPGKSNLGRVAKMKWVGPAPGGG